MVEFAIVEKGATLEIKDKETGAALNKLYVGAGWDTGEAAVDLDLVAACLSGGKLTAQTRLVYFGDKTEPGVTLSADNTTGKGDGDDESIVFDLSQVEADVDSIAIGLVAYRGADLSTAKNVHFRGVDGLTAGGKQVFDAPVSSASAGDTVLHAVTLKREAAGWSVTNVGSFTKGGSGGEAVKAFANLFA